MIKQTAVRSVILEINACKKCPYFHMDTVAVTKGDAFIACQKWYFVEVVKLKKVDIELKKWIDKCLFADVRVLHEDKIEKLPDYGDLFPVKRFIEICKNGGFIDWDGSGYFSDGKYLYRNEQAIPSKVNKIDFNPRNFSHVAWFNK